MFILQSDLYNSKDFFSLAYTDKDKRPSLLVCFVIIDVILSFAATSREPQISLVTKQNVSLLPQLVVICLPVSLQKAAVIVSSQCPVLFANRVLTLSC